jgi:glycosyltransferase involved in cell wall biosynthesis
VTITMHSLPPPGSTPVAQLLAQVDRRLGPGVRWTAVSTTAATALRRVLPDRQIGVLHNGIDARPWQTGDDPMAARPLTVVSTMRLAPRKRPGALLRILEEVRRQVASDVPLRAVIAGSGPRAAASARTIRRRGLADWVELPGRLDRAQLRRLYAQADVYLAPAELESFGIAALEARCAGLPVVAMASGGVGEFVRHGVEGFLVIDDDAMAAATTLLLTDPALLGRIRTHNRATLPAMTWDVVTDQHLRLYAARTRTGDRALR